MFERKLNQKALAELLGTNTARISEYMKGKREITMKIAKGLYYKLNIDLDIILNRTQEPSEMNHSLQNQ